MPLLNSNKTPKEVGGGGVARVEKRRQKYIHFSCFNAGKLVAQEKELILKSLFFPLLEWKMLSAPYWLAFGTKKMITIKFSILSLRPLISPFISDMSEAVVWL